MRGYQLRPKARQDLEGIVRYTRATWGVAKAQSYLRAIQRALLGVAETPEIGRPYSSPTQDYLRVRAGSHIVFFRMSGETILIVRVLHERMNFDDHL